MLKNRATRVRALRCSSTARSSSTFPWAGTCSRRLVAAVSYRLLVLGSQFSVLGQNQSSPGCVERTPLSAAFDFDFLEPIIFSNQSVRAVRERPGHQQSSLRWLRVFCLQIAEQVLKPLRVGIVVLPVTEIGDVVFANFDCQILSFVG